MPQLDFSTYASQIFWLIITFGALYFIMARNALPTVRQVLQDRQLRISDDLKKAEKLKEEAESAQSDFTSSLNEAKRKSHDIIANARADMAKIAAEKHAKLDQTFEKQKKEAEQRIQILKKEETERLIDISTVVAHNMVEKLTNLEADKTTLESHIKGQLAA